MPTLTVTAIMLDARCNWNTCVIPSAQHGHFISKQNKVRQLLETIKLHNGPALADIVSVSKCPDAGDGLPKDKGMDVVRSLVRVCDLQICCMSANPILIAASIPTEHVQQRSCMEQRLTAVVSLDQTNHIGGPVSFVLEATNAVRRMKSERSFCHCVRKFLLDQLEGCDWTRELLAIQGVRTCLINAVLKGAHDTPGDAVPGVVEARKRRREASCAWQQGIWPYFN